MQITKYYILKMQFVNHYWYFQWKLQKIKFSGCKLLIITDTSNANYKRLNSQVAIC